MVEVDIEQARAKLLSTQMDPKVVESTLKNKKVTARMVEVIDLAGLGDACDKNQGVLLYNLATKLPPSCLDKTQLCLDFIKEKKWVKIKQIDEAFKYLKDNNAAAETDIAALEKASGVGIVVTSEDVDNAVKAIFEEQKEAIMDKKHSYQFNNVIYEAQKRLPWGENKEIIAKINALKLEWLGEAPKVEGRQKKNKAEKKPKEAEKPKEEEKKEEPEETEGLIASLDKIGRDLASTKNTPELMAKHKEFTQGRIVTRFPPEPNGYLHIGHAKSMRLNYLGAKQVDGICYLRYDDTNPCKENHEFIEHIEKNVKWMGHKPWKITHASDYFQLLRDLAVELINRGKAYVCHMTKAEVNKSRETQTDSPYRNRSIEENLKLFKMMELGCFAEGECCLRMKIDMQHENPNMWDPIAYRIRYVPHPMSGDKWCIYPTYDYTHCLCDSIENITHSCCTLEFESRRESYYWLLEALDLYRPQVKEFSRLNITYTVLSKRRLEWLVNSKNVRGWDDPRLLTLEGLRRRGFTPEIINNFCKEIGVSRKGNENMTSIKLLEHHARQVLDKSAPRIFAVVDPLLVEIVNFDEYTGSKDIKADLFPTDPSRGNQTYEIGRNVYIEREDFSKDHKSGFFGLTPNQKVMLRYSFVIELVNVIEDDNGNVVSVQARYVPDFKDKLKGVIQWVNKDHALDAEVRLINLLFTIEDPMSKRDKWVEYLNPESMIIKDNAKVWGRVAEKEVGFHYQFERTGYFCLDKDSTPEKPVFNRVVELRESNLKKGEQKKTK